ncbi:MAG: TlpA family protein disulfide reductase [Nitrospinae bacterium]|nr:TlpA family protein disulfide reductase [Nitrospinota bacterium]
MSRALAAGLALAVIALAGCEAKPMEAPPKQQPRPAPSLTLPRLGGGEMSLQSLRGKPALVNFWATWCVPCLKEMPEIERFFQIKKADGLAVAMINVKESAAAVESFMAPHGYTFTVLLDEKGEAVEKFQVFGLPTTVFIDRDGVIRYTHMGELTREILYMGYREINPPPLPQQK